jgi:uncharacterized protein (DUF2267 family)
MSVTGLETFDHTVHKTNEWLKRVMELLGWDDRRLAYTALRATLHALRDRLTVQEAADLAAQLPMLVRGFYYEGWDPTGKPLKIRDREEFLDLITREFRGADEPVDAELVARAVFRLLSERITGAEVEDLRSVLPTEIRSLWDVPATVGVAG